MDFSKIVAISGKSGLFKIISQSNTNLIVESLDSKKRIPVFASDQSSKLEDISVFTKNEDIPLKEVLWKIFETEEEGECSISHKSDNNTLKSYFEKIIPEYDEDRVYSSDIKKIIMWYNILQKHNLITKPEEDNEKEEEKKTGEKETGEKETEEKETEEKESGEKTKADTVASKDNKTKDKKTGASKKRSNNK